jgi:hypothetical protein
MRSAETLTPCRDRDLITFAEAAVIAGRSYSWVRDRVIEGGLTARVSARGPRLVTAESLRALLESRASATRVEHRRQGPSLRLRLVVDNTAS